MWLYNELLHAGAKTQFIHSPLEIYSVLCILFMSFGFRNRKGFTSKGSLPRGGLFLFLVSMHEIIAPYIINDT